MAEEDQKHNTDCVYFLASPLTCKKGNACEFRHSESARMNPRDCRYWLSGNCLMPNCSFRHPPLDGKRTLVAAVTTVSSATRASVSVTSKSGVPCYFFSQGYCAKGSRCPFLHGTAVPVSNATSFQKLQKPSTGGQTEINDSQSNPVKGNVLAAQDPLSYVATGFLENPPNVFIRTRNPSVPGMGVTKAKASAEFAAVFPLKGQSGDKQSETAGKPHVKDSQLHKAVGSTATGLKKQVEHYERNGLPKERSPLCVDASSSLLYEEDTESFPERNFQHQREMVLDKDEDFEHDYENAQCSTVHGHIGTTEGFMYDSNYNSIIFDDTQSNNLSTRMRSGGDLREYLTRQRMLHKEHHLSVNGDNLNLETDYHTGFERQLLPEQKGEYSRRPSDRGDYRDFKRLRYDIDFESDRIHKRHGHVKGKLSSASNACFESDMNSGYPTSRAAFSGPKSLAQIKAEQGKDLELNGHRGERQRDLCTGLSNRQLIKSQILTASSCDFDK